MIASDLGRLTRHLHPGARPLAMVFIVPLAASCFLAVPQISGGGLPGAPARGADVTALPDRVREVIEAAAEEAKPLDPPARSSRWMGDGKGAADQLAPPMDGIGLLQAGTPRFLPQTSETFLNAPRAGGHPRRGPPERGT